MWKHSIYSIIIWHHSESVLSVHLSLGRMKLQISALRYYFHTLYLSCFCQVLSEDWTKMGVNCCISQQRSVLAVAEVLEIMRDKTMIDLATCLLRLTGRRQRQSQSILWKYGLPEAGMGPSASNCKWAERARIEMKQKRANHEKRIACEDSNCQSFWFWIQFLNDKARVIMHWIWISDLDKAHI